jgi:transposase
MPKRISVATHLSVEELEQRYREAKQGVESRQYHIIWLLAQGKKTEEVEEITGYSRTWIYALVKRYNELGIEALGDGRRHNPGAEPLISDIHQAQLWQVLQGKAPDGGLWNGRKVADWLSEVTGKNISRQRGWEILRQMTFRLRVPRPCHTESDPVEQQAWKKKLLQK